MRRADELSRRDRQRDRQQGWRPRPGKSAQGGGQSEFIDHTLFEEREDFERKLDETLREDGVEFIALAGFMRILTPWFVDKWKDA
jgi:folate-dependent phosphoribosylglycinamide formyltransferase PurN